MKKNQLTDMQSASSKVNLILSFLMTVYNTFSYFINGDQYGILGICIAAAFFLTDLWIGVMHHHRFLWTGVRIAELVVVSFCFGNVENLFSIALIALLLLVLLLQLQFSFDYSDMYTRVVTLALSLTPSAIILLLVMLLGSTDMKQCFAKCCVLIAIADIVFVLSDLVVNELDKLEQRLFEQRRMVENTCEINEMLKQHQEKVKRANEELGVQKIKLESAYNRINSANTEMILQNDILKKITSVLEVERLLIIMTEILSNELGLSACGILLMEGAAGNEQPVCIIHSNLSGQDEENLKNAVLGGCLEPYTVHRNGFVDNHVRPGRYEFLTDDNIGSLLVLPMQKESRVIVELLAVHQRFDYFNDNRVFFDTIMSQFMIALENAGLYARVQHMAIRDSLTGIYNRGHLNLMMEYFSEQAEKHNMPLSVALIDIDHFKNVNDTYGHLTGDRVIKMIASIADKVAQKYQGFAARYGGEEFVLAFLERNIICCCEIIEEMRGMIHNMVLECNGVQVHVNVSVGVTGYPECCSRPDDLLEHADWAMYYSKKNGRNQVTIDSAEIRQKLGLSVKAKE